MTTNLSQRPKLSKFIYQFKLSRNQMSLFLHVTITSFLWCALSSSTAERCVVLGLLLLNWCIARGQCVVIFCEEIKSGKRMVFARKKRFFWKKKAINYIIVSKGVPLFHGILFSAINSPMLFYSQNFLFPSMENANFFGG